MRLVSLQKKIAAVGGQKKDAKIIGHVLKYAPEEYVTVNTLV